MSDTKGDLCVIPDDTHAHWLVSICKGPGQKRVLMRFASRDKAAEWAINERARLNALGQGITTIHFPDDCPCSGGTIKW